MILQHLSDNVLQVKFTSDDWNLGIAKQAIDLMKSFPKGSKMYNPQKKTWTVFKRKAEAFNLKYLYQLQEKALEAEKILDEEEDFDVEKWKDDTFGKEQGVV